MLDTIRISTGNGILGNIPVKRFIYETSNSDQEFHDILVFEAADEWKEKNFDLPYFFSLTPFSISNRIKSFLIGYPTLPGVMDDYFEGFISGNNAEIHMKCAIAGCDIDETYVSAAEHFRRYTHMKSRPMMDGYSGGAIFSLIGDLGSYEIVLDGIVLRGNKDFIYTVDADYVLKAIRTSAAQH